VNEAERHQRLKAAFNEAVSLDGEGRAAILARLQAAEPELAAEVAALLQADETATSFMAEPAILAAAPQMVQGERGYRVLHELGSGGMGSVYLAERADGEFRQRVAIKFLRPGAATSLAAARRFRIERQILADLEHPHITRLLDGGTTRVGQSFLVMEYVAGEPLDRYCDRLPVRDRLRLFATVCRAVHFAHERRIVHRDLKPSNVLVDAHGNPKLLDFGIAKLLDPSPEDGTRVETVIGHVPMTILYASPEQVRGEEITPASDVYSLGVLLYRLLTGALPYGGNTETAHDIFQAICEREPPRPSVLARRTTTTSPLDRGLDHDLDAIALRALRKEPDQRYPSAAALADDVERYLDGLPVTARRGTALYRVRKLVRRRATLVALAAASLVAVALTAVLTYRLAAPPALVAPGAIGRIAVLPFRNATGSRTNDWVELGLAQIVTQLVDEARHVEAVPVADVERAMRDLGIPEDRPPASESLARLRRAVGADFAAAAEVTADRPEGYRVSYALYSPQGTAARREIRGAELTAMAGEMAKRLALRLDPGARIPEVKDRLSEDPLVNSLYAMGVQELSRGGGVDAQHYFLVALHRAPDLAWARLMLGRSLIHLQRWSECEAALLEALRAARATRDRRLEGEALSSLGLVAADRGDVAGALRWDGEAIGVLTRSGNRKGLSNVLNNLGTLAWNRGDLAEAEARFRASLALLEKLHEPRGQAGRLNNLGLMAAERGDKARAAELYRQALARARESGDRTLQSTVLTNLGYAAQNAGDLATAERLHRQVLALNEAMANLGGQATALLNLGVVAVRRGDKTTAEGLVRRALQRSREAADPRLEGFVLANLSFLLTERGDFAAGAAAGRDARDLADRIQNARLRVLTNVNLAYAEIAGGSLAAAREALAIAEKLDPKDVATLRVRALYEYRRGRLREALALQEEAKRNVKDPTEWRVEHEEALVAMREAARQGRRLPLPIPGFKSVL
jgi:tetratricopeptide (TPR) repeat protein/predicted Ser/Thr protein kinase